MAISFKAARVNAGLTQADVMREMGVTQATITSWEKGITYPTIKQAKALAGLYNCTIDDFLIV